MKIIFYLFNNDIIDVLDLPCRIIIKETALKQPHIFPFVRNE